VILANRLAGENSPYLLQHASNPVDWYPWGAEALEKSRAEDKPIFLSIGYAACHWCHVMAHESFEDPQIAQILNGSFICIKVDREERPDLDFIYMKAVVAMTGQGGWPLSVFLTPQGEPFYGGTYFPPKAGYNLPSFYDVITSISRLWHEDRAKLVQSAKEVVQSLINSSEKEEKTGLLSPQVLDQAVYRLAQTYNWKSGGWGQAPKFPQPMVIEFLLQRAAAGDKLAQDMALHCLDAMSQGGMYDIVGGGFARYSTDDMWLVPHFEKMLYDNALLAKVYLYAYLMTREDKYLRVCRSTLEFIIREMTSADVGFFSSLDADSGGKEGQYYLWNRKEIQDCLLEAQSSSTKFQSINWADFYFSAFDITQEGNYNGQTIIRRNIDDSELAIKYKITETEAGKLLDELNGNLLAKRLSREHPAIDDKVLVSWNALAIIAFSDAARYLDHAFYLDIALKCANFIWDKMYRGNILFRSWRNGKAQNNAYLEDYAALLVAFLSLYQSSHEVIWFDRAKILLNEIQTHFRDTESGFFDTRDDHETLLIRPKDRQDNATPSGNSLALIGLLQLASYDGMQEWHDEAEKAMISLLGGVVNYYLYFGNWLCAFNTFLTPTTEIAILFPEYSPRSTEFDRVIWAAYRPNCIVAASTYPPQVNSPRLLKDRALAINLATVYVCHDFLCEPPVNTPLELQDILDKATGS
jgi:uncharacterized protein YyaL (SSP411 family)